MSTDRRTTRTKLLALAALGTWPGMVLLLTTAALGVTGLGTALPTGTTRVMALVGLPLFLLGLPTAYLHRGHAHDRPVAVQAPVRGRWTALNSPASRVPSHGTHAYGQAHAIDLVADPADGSRPQFGSGPAFRPPTDFPAFGQPLLAPADGVVVGVRDTHRDHRSRSSLAAYAYMLVEGMLRELGGAGGIIGNRIVIDHGDGVWSLMAHLQRGSALVRPGDAVAAGQVVAACGNSGNSSEPHVHLQLMDHARPTMAAGIPFTFTDVAVEDDPASGLPGNGRSFTADPARPAGRV